VLKFTAIAFAAAVLLGGCATEYQSSSLSGGFKDQHVAEDVYRVSFGANGYATRETAQTYWLYRASELTLEKGFQGFEVLSPLALGAGQAESPYVKATFIYIPMMDDSHKPYLEADIRLLKGPIAANPPKIFDANVLKTELEQYVKGEKKCSGGNVCPHIKKYLQPVSPQNVEPSAKAI
jgi:hypothetical protein